MIVADDWSGYAGRILILDKPGTWSRPIKNAIPRLPGTRAALTLYGRFQGPPGTQVDVRLVRDLPKGPDDTGLQSYVIGPTGQMFVTHTVHKHNTTHPWHWELRPSSPVTVRESQYTQWAAEQ